MERVVSRQGRVVGDPTFSAGQRAETEQFRRPGRL
jgi:hypothetical protein